MSRLTRDGTAEPVSRDQILRHARGQGNIHFPCSADHEQDWQPYPVDPYSAICDDHTYIHTYIHTHGRRRGPLTTWCYVVLPCKDLLVGSSGNWQQLCLKYPYRPPRDQYQPYPLSHITIIAPITHTPAISCPLFRSSSTAIMKKISASVAAVRFVILLSQYLPIPAVAQNEILDGSRWKLVAPSSTSLPSIEPPGAFGRSENIISPLGAASYLNDARPALLPTNKFFSSFLVSPGCKRHTNLPTAYEFVKQ